MGGLKHIYFLKKLSKAQCSKIRENNTLFNYLSDIKIRKWLLKIKPVEYIADMTEYSRLLNEYWNLPKLTLKRHKKNTFRPFKPLFYKYLAFLTSKMPAICCMTNIGK